MAYLNSDYRNGYNRALADVRKYLEGHKSKLKSAKLNSIDGTIKIVRAMIRYKVEMRDTGSVDLAMIDGKRIKHVKEITEEEFARDAQVKKLKEESKYKISAKRREFPTVIRYL